MNSMRGEELGGKVSGVSEALDVDSALRRDGDPRDGPVPQAHPEPRLRVHLVVNREDICRLST